MSTDKMCSQCFINLHILHKICRYVQMQICRLLLNIKLDFYLFNRLIWNWELRSREVINRLDSFNPWKESSFLIFLYLCIECKKYKFSRNAYNSEHFHTMPAARAILWKCESWSCSSWAGLPCSSTEPRSSTIIWRYRYKESLVCFTPHLVPGGDGVQPVGDGEHGAAAELCPQGLLGPSVGDM